MQTTTTTTTTLPALAPVFDPQAAGEPWPAYGRRAVSYLLAHGLAGSWQLSDAAIEAAADGARVAATACAREQVQLAGVLAQLERDARRLLVGRVADRARRLAAWLDAADAQGPTAAAAPDGPPEAPAAPQGGPQGGGGAKVPRTPRGPQRPGGGAYVQAADETGGGAFRVPAAVAALRPVPALTAAADDLF